MRARSRRGEVAQLAAARAGSRPGGLEVRGAPGASAPGGREAADPASPPGLPRFRGWNPPQTLARVLASGSLLPFPSRVGTRVLLGLRGLDFSRSISELVLLSGRRARARPCPRVHPGSQMIAERMLDCGWREDKLIPKCAWAGGPRLGRLGIEGGGSAGGCEGETPCVGRVAPGEGV